MAASPNFATIPLVGTCLLTTANTARDSAGVTSGSKQTLVTFPTKGGVLRKIVLMADGDPAACMVNIFLLDGSTYTFLYQFNLAGNPAAAGNAAPAYNEERAFEDEFEGATSLVATITVAPTTGGINLIAFCHEFT